MELTEDEIIQKYAKKRLHCFKKTLLPYEFEFFCFSCGYDVINVKSNEKTNSLKFTESEKFLLLG